MVDPESKEGTLGLLFYLRDPDVPVTMAQCRGTVVPQRQVFRHTGGVRAISAIYPLCDLRQAIPPLAASVLYL